MEFGRLYTLELEAILPLAVHFKTMLADSSSTTEMIPS